MMGLLALFGLLAAGLALDAFSNDDPPSDEETDAEAANQGNEPRYTGTSIPLQEQVSEMMRALQQEEAVLSQLSDTLSQKAEADGGQSAEAAAAAPLEADLPEPSVNTEGIAMVDSFDPASEVLVIQSPDAETDNAEVSVHEDEDGITSVITLGGTEIARVQSAGMTLTEENIRFVVADT